MWFLLVPSRRPRSLCPTWRASTRVRRRWWLRRSWSCATSWRLWSRTPPSSRPSEPCLLQGEILGFHFLLSIFICSRFSPVEDLAAFAFVALILGLFVFLQNVAVILYAFKALRFNQNIQEMCLQCCKKTTNSVSLMFIHYWGQPLFWILEDIKLKK